MKVIIFSIFGELEIQMGRDIHGSKRKPNLLMERIDFFIVSGSVTSLTIDADIYPTFLSDHAIPHITLADETGDTGPGYWKLNVSLLEQDDIM